MTAASTVTTAFAALALACSAQAQQFDDAERFGLHAQSTWIWQAKPAFAAAYSGRNSLLTQREKSYSFTATLAAGLRLWPGGEAYLNPELVQGVPLSALVGMGGLSNGELQKTAGSNPVLYRARAFVRQTWSFSDDTSAVTSGFNQLAGRLASDRLTLTIGNFAVSDVFDANRYAHDARSQFVNWALLDHGQFDFAADSRGYSQGAALEWSGGDWSLRAGRFLVPRESNGLALDPHAASVHGDQVELEHRHTAFGRAGAVRLLAFDNRERMARFDDALLAAAPAGAAPPTLDGVRRLQHKRGWGVSAEQELGGDIGGFVRFGRHDGATEPYSFASIDDAVSAGVQFGGSRWGRAGDVLGVAGVSNGLSAAHRRYLAAGGSDFFIGDGALRGRRERTAEAYYSAAVGGRLRVSLDVQHTAAPAYNGDRGPVRTFALRLHGEI